MVTFPKKPHLYRGENKEWRQSVPSLRRDLDSVGDQREQEMLVALAHMRKWQFARLLMRINIVPFWMAKLSDVNWDALAQHYGFKTCLLDLTSDFRAALFFATCAYDRATNAYRPLTQDEIEADERSSYGCIFHTPNWTVDATEPGLFWRLYGKHESGDPHLRNSIQSGFYDGMAFQIGFQPLQRCDRQSGYVYPMRRSQPLQEEGKFERLRFRQSVELSRRVYEAMDGGRKVFPNEGITELEEVLRQLRCTTTFTVEDLELAYEHDAIDRSVYPTIESLRRDLEGCTLDGGNKVTFADESIEIVPQDMLDHVNAYYDEVDIIEAVGGYIHIKPDDRRYFERRSIDLFGRVV